jgi:hypothetical protein
VRDGVRQPRQILKKSDHRWRLAIGPLRDCARMS